MMGDTDDVVVGCLSALVIGVIVIGIVFAVLGLRFDPTTDGTHSGYVTAIEQSGFIWQNYGIYFKTDNSSSQEDQYCIEQWNKPLADQLKIAQEKRERITISYEGVKGIGLNLCHHARITGFTVDQ